MTDRTYWKIYQLMIILEILGLIYTPKVESLNYEASQILLLIVAIYNVTYLNSYIRMYKGEVKTLNKAYIVFSICLPMFYILFYTTTLFLK